VLDGFLPLSISAVSCQQPQVHLPDVAEENLEFKQVWVRSDTDFECLDVLAQRLLLLTDCAIEQSKRCLLSGVELFSFYVGLR
jgi:hypothetical protein